MPSLSEAIANTLEYSLVETFDGTQHLYITTSRGYEIYDDTSACVT